MESKKSVADEPMEEEADRGAEAAPTRKMYVYACDRCGFEMIEKNCKVHCPNCGSQLDCSDLNIYFD